MYQQNLKFKYIQSHKIINYRSYCHFFQKKKMSRVCCKLHKFLDTEDFTTILDNERFKDFCSFLQTSSNKRNRSLLPLENPNDKEVYIYLFGGVGTRYLTTVLGEFITFISNVKSTKTKWFPVIGVKKTVQTKSLTILGSAKLPIALLLLLSYYECNLKHNYDCNNLFELSTHMSITSLIPSLLYMLEQTNDAQLQNLLIKKLTSITLCDNCENINCFQTQNISSSFSAYHRNIIGHFGHHLTLYCNDKKELTQQEEREEIWRTQISIFLMTKNWTETPCGYNNLSTISNTGHLNSHLYPQIHPILEQEQPPPPMIRQYLMHPPYPTYQQAAENQQSLIPSMEQYHPFQTP